MIFALYHRVPIQHSDVQRVYELFRDADFFAIAFAAGIVFYAGLIVSARHPKVYQSGKWLGALAFLAYVAAGICFDGHNPLDSLFAYTVKGTVFAILAIGLSRFVGTLAVLSWDAFMFFPRRFASHRAESRRRAKAEARRLEEQQERIRQEEQKQIAIEERRRWTIEYDKRQQEAARRVAAEEQRRSDARAECELCYSQHVKEIGKRFPKPMFDKFIRTYMDQSQAVESVERRAKELQRIIEFHRDAAKPPKKFYTLADLTKWFVQEKEQLDSLPVSEELREEQLIALNVRYSELSQTMLDKIRP